MNKYFIMLVLGLIPNLGFCVLGETPEQIQARYGSPSGRPTTTNTLQELSYAFAGNDIHISYLEGHCAQEMITPKDRNKKFSEEEILAFGSAIAGVSKTAWTNRFYDRLAGGVDVDWEAGKYRLGVLDMLKYPAVFVTTSDFTAYQLETEERKKKMLAQEIAAKFGNPEKINPPTLPEKNIPAPVLDPNIAIEAAKKTATEARILKWHQELAAKGDSYGQLKMGLRYLKGDGVEADPVKARDLLAKSAAQGNKEAAAELGKLK